MNNKVKQAYYGESEQGYRLLGASAGISHETREFMKKHVYLAAGESEDMDVSIRYFARPEKQEYILMYCHYLKKKTRFDDRNQMFAHCFVFDREQAGQVMQYPENIFYFPHLKNPEEIPEEGCKEIKMDWSFWSRPMGGAEKEKYISQDVFMQYIYCISQNTPEKMKVQIYHIFEDFKEGKWRDTFAASLKKLPIENRVALSFAINPKDHQECGMCEINVMDREVYHRLRNSRSQGQKVLEKRILIDGESVEVSGLTPKEEQWFRKRYQTLGKTEDDTKMIPGDREEKNQKTGNRDFAGKSGSKYDEYQKIKGIRFVSGAKNGNLKTLAAKLLPYGKLLLFLGLTGWILSRFYFFAAGVPGGVIIHLNISNNVWVFAAQMAAALLFVSLKNDFVKRRKKGAMNHESVVSNGADSDGTGIAKGK